MEIITIILNFILCVFFTVLAINSTVALTKDLFPFKKWKNRHNSNKENIKYYLIAFIMFSIASCCQIITIAEKIKQWK